LGGLVSDRALVNASVLFLHLLYDKEVLLSFAEQVIFGCVGVTVQFAVLKEPLGGCGL